MPTAIDPEVPVEDRPKPLTDLVAQCSLCEDEFPTAYEAYTHEQLDHEGDAPE